MVGQNPIILIPARMASTRLPNKPLALICGVPMIVQVLKRAQEADCGRVVVAAAEQEIADLLDKQGKYWCALFPEKDDEKEQESETPDDDEEKTTTEN